MADCLLFENRKYAITRPRIIRLFTKFCTFDIEIGVNLNFWQILRKYACFSAYRGTIKFKLQPLICMFHVVFHEANRWRCNGDRKDFASPQVDGCPFYRDQLWTAPELLRMTTRPINGTQKADVYSFAIVLQEIVFRAAPYFIDMHFSSGMWAPRRQLWSKC